MIKHHLKMAFRSLSSQKLFSAINIGGLALGLAVCMIIMLYVAHELSYNRFLKNADRIYSVSQRISFGSSTMEDSYFSYATGPLVKQADARVEAYTRLYHPYTDALVQNTASPDLKFTESKMLFADKEFFNFFSFQLIKGDARTVLSRPFCVVISKKAAAKYFGNADPVGKTLLIKTDSALTYQVTGVAENAPSNSSIGYDFIASNSSLPAMHTARRSFKSGDGWGRVFDLLFTKTGRRYYKGFKHHAIIGK